MKYDLPLKFPLVIYYQKAQRTRSDRIPLNCMQGKTARDTLHHITIAIVRIRGDYVIGCICPGNISSKKVFVAACAKDADSLYIEIFIQVIE